MEIDREAVVSLLLPMLIKLKPFKESDKGTAGKMIWKMLKKVTRKLLKKLIESLFLNKCKLKHLLYCQH